MLSFKVLCNPYILEKRNFKSHIEDGETDMLSFKVVYNPTGNMVAAISISGGPRG